MPRNYGGAAAGSDPFISLPDGALDQWVAARSAARLCPVAFIGDSITRGASATGFSDGHFAAAVTRALQAQYGNGGEGFHAVSDTTDAAYAGATNYSAKTRPCWSFGPGWSGYFAYGMAGQAHTTTAGQGSYAVGAFIGTAVDVWVGQNGGGGAFSVQVDGQFYDVNGVQGGGGGNPSCYSATIQSPVKAVSMGGLAPGAHTIVLTTTAGGTLILHGITAYSGLGRGIVPYPMGFVGRGVWQTAVNTTADTPKGSIEFLQPQPKLVVFGHIVNDMQQQIAYDTFAFQARRYCDSARVAGASFVFLIPFIGPLAGNWLNTSYAHHYVDRIYSLARRYGAAVLDINAAWEALGPAGAAALTVGGGNSHPNDAGHADIAARLSGLLT